MIIYKLTEPLHHSNSEKVGVVLLLSKHSGGDTMLHHITRDCFIIMVSLWDKASGYVCTGWGKAMSLTSTFHSPFPTKMYLAGFRNELLFNRDTGTKKHFPLAWSLLWLWYSCSDTILAARSFLLRLKPALFSGFDLSKKIEVKSPKNYTQIGVMGWLNCARQ